MRVCVYVYVLCSGVGVFSSVCVGVGVGERGVGGCQNPPSKFFASPKNLFPPTPLIYIRENPGCAHMCVRYLQGSGPQVFFL